MKVLVLNDYSYSGLKFVKESIENTRRRTDSLETGAGPVSIKEVTKSVLQNIKLEM